MRKNYFTFLLLIPFTLILSGCDGSISKSINSELKVLQPSYNFGKVAMDAGNVTTTYKITNTGKEPVTVREMYTSCMCTTARLTTKEDTSPMLGMKGHGSGNFTINQTIASLETAEVEVVFDPAAHGPQGVGRIQRVVFLDTNSLLTPEIQLNLQADVVATSTELAYKNPLEFSEKEYDFGVVKQSASLVTYNFTVTYIGNDPIKITALPTSCGCTSAKISQSELKKGDKAIITVAFDPNLHEEPHGRFFKTIAVITDPALEETPVIKIWAEVELDLGPSAFKLKQNHDESKY